MPDGFAEPRGGDEAARRFGLGMPTAAVPVQGFLVSFGQQVILTGKIGGLGPVEKSKTRRLGTLIDRQPGNAGRRSRFRNA